MEVWRKYLILVAGFLEALFFSGSLFGWPSLLLILQQEGVYQHVCTVQTVMKFNESIPSIEQIDMYNSTFSNITGTPAAYPESVLETITGQESQNPDVGFIDAKIKCVENCSLFELDQNLTEDRTFNSSEVSRIDSCDNQRIEMTLIYTFAAVLFGIISAFIGFSLEYMGLRITRLIGSALACTGFMFLAFTSSDKSFFLWPALNLIGLGTNMLRFSGFLFADLVPEYRATVITTYSSAYSISTTFFLLMQIIYEAGVPMRVIFIVCTGGCALTFIPTFFMPMMQIVEHKGEAAVTKNSIPNNTNNEEEVKDSLLLDNLNKDGKILKETNLHPKKEADNEVSKSDAAETTLDPLTIKQSIFSLSGILHMNWQFINLLLVLFYSSTFNIWALKVTDDINQVSFYIKLSGVCCIIVPIFVPVFGYITDKMIHRANKFWDPVEQLAHKMQAPVFAMIIATLLLTLTMICKMFFTETAIYLSLLFIALSRPAVVGSCTSYIRLRFPADQFNILNGVFTTIISVLCFVQYPVMKWMTSSHAAYQQAHWILTAYLFLSLASPGHMMIRKNIIAYARRRLLVSD